MNILIKENRFSRFPYVTTEGIFSRPLRETEQARERTKSKDEREERRNRQEELATAETRLGNLPLVINRPAFPLTLAVRNSKLISRMRTNRRVHH